MYTKGIKGVLLLLSLAVCVLAGCDEVQEEPENVIENPYAGVVSMEKTPVVDYVVPEQQPNILVDQRGFFLSDEKVAAVKGKSLPEEFRVIDALTGLTVYRGAVEDIVCHEEMELYSGRVDFSAVEAEGTYYLECDIIGRSDSFGIHEQIYIGLFDEIYGQMVEKCQQRSLTLPEAAALLEAYEWYSDIFPDEDRDEIPDVLRELRGWVAYMEENGTEEEEKAMYAALLAKFSYLYQKFDRQYATDCLKRASTVFGQIQPALSRDADIFWALTELYRATGRYTYRKQIVDHKSFFENSSNYLEDRSYLYAAMTYISTRQRVDVELCEDFMNNLMQNAEETSVCYAEMIDPVAAKNNGSAHLLKYAVELSCANYIMNNYQYTGIMEEFLHYLMGQNFDSVCFYDEGEDRGEYFLLFAQLAANHGSH